MDRRRFLQSTTAAALASTGVANGATQTTGANNRELSVAARFHQSIPDKPWLRGFQTASAESFAAPATVTGKLPDELVGSLYRTGPARHEIGDFRYGHWFDGDGMVQRWQIGNEAVSHTAKMVITDKYRREIAAGRALYPAFGSVPPDAAAVTKADDVNVANISMLHHHGQLFALWEAGSPWQIDQHTLETKERKVFSAETDGLPFSAHPRIEADGTLWNFGYASDAGMLVFWKIDSQGHLSRAGVVKSDPMGMPHDFIVTRNHIVLMIAPLHFKRDPDSSTFLDAHTWHGDDPTRLLVVDKNNFNKTSWYELPAQWVFHFGNGWDDNKGNIYFDGSRADNPDAMLHDFRVVMEGGTPGAGTTRHYQYRIDTRRGRVEEAPIFSPTLISEFPDIDKRVSCVRNDRMILLSSNRDNPPPHGLLNAVSVANMRTERVDTYTYDANVLPEEHLFVAKPGAMPEKEGWVVGTCLDCVKQQSQLNVFNVNAIADGPIASATLPYALPLGLHGTFV